jgi:16S rRNA (uracil1498-N3)-methyltransferase
VLRASVPRFVVVGPEGGFTPQEIDDARRRGAALARLGPAVLRAETAALAALAVVASCATT